MRDSGSESGSAGFAAAADDAAASGNAAAAAAKGRILVVDDDRLVLATLVHGLASAGYDVIDADNGDDAILLARAERPDLALLDIRMEGKSGFDVAAYLREQLQMPFMFLSAFTDERTLAQVKDLGAVAYLVKPLDVSQIVPAVSAALGRARSQPSRPVEASPRDGSVLAEPVPIAVGVLMHRYSLPRADALARLARLAAEDGVSLAAGAEGLLKAMELLARPGAG